ncbi:uncharacterized protein [Amphiura filiformis]|uniref:uncharacterized protein n=1 Tax=Amphiura filiformis TaxID=82378 RepID=UPI003B213C4A
MAGAGTTCFMVLVCLFFPILQLTNGQQTDIIDHFIMLIDGTSYQASTGQIYVQPMAADLNFTTADGNTSDCFASSTFVFADPNSYVYLTNCDMSKVYRMNPRDSSYTIETVIDTGGIPQTYTSDGGIAHDFFTDKLYFGGNRADAYEIYTSSGDGTGVASFISKTGTNVKVTDMAFFLDVDGGSTRYLYYVEDMDGVFNIVRCTGPSAGSCTNIVSDSQSAFGLDIVFITIDADSNGTRIFFTDYRSNIGSINIDGTDPQTIGTVRQQAKKPTRVQVYFKNVYFTTTNLQANKAKDLYRIPKNGSAASDDPELVGVEDFQFPNSLFIFQSPPCINGVMISEAMDGEYLIKWSAADTCWCDEYLVTLQNANSSMQLPWQDANNVTVNAAFPPWESAFVEGRIFPRDGQEAVYYSDYATIMGTPFPPAGPCISGVNASVVSAGEYLIEVDVNLFCGRGPFEYQITLNQSSDDSLPITLPWQNASSVTIKAVGPSPFDHVYVAVRNFPRDGQEQYSTSVNVSIPAGNGTGTDFGMPLRFVMREVWFGGFLAEMKVHINETTTSWMINIDFRRQVFSFSIEGCEAEVTERVNGEIRRPKGGRGTMYVLTPSGDDEILEAGDVLHLTMVGKVWHRYRPRENFIIGAEMVAVTIS